MDNNLKKSVFKLLLLRLDIVNNTFLVLDVFNVLIQLLQDFFRQERNVDKNPAFIFIQLN